MRRVLFTFPFFFLSTPALFPQDNPIKSKLWEHTFPADIQHFEVTTLGGVFVSTEDEIAVLDPGHGEVIWSSSVLRDCNDEKAPVGGGHYQPKHGGYIRAPGNYVWCRRGSEKHMRLSTYPMLPVILAASGKDLVLLDTSNGDVIWDASELELPLEHVRWSAQVARASVIVWAEVRDEDRSLVIGIDLQSGDYWRTELPVKENLSLVGEDDSFMENLAQDGRQDLIVMTGEDGSGRVIMATIDADTGGLLYANELPFKKGDWHFVRPENPMMLMGDPRDGDKTVVGIDVETGEVLYSSTVLADELEDSPRRLLLDLALVFGPDSALVVDPSVDFAEFGDTLEVLSDGDKRVMGVNPWTGEILWSPERSRRWRAWAYQSGTLFVKADGQVTAYRTSDGAQLWQSESDAEHLLWATDRGILVGCGSALELCRRKLEFYDLETGESIWGETVEIGENTREAIVIEGVLFPVSDDRVYRVDLVTGSYQEFLEFNLHDGEEPTAVREYDGGLLLRSAQNVLFVDAQGELQYHLYYKSPGMSFWEQAATLAGAAAFNALSELHAMRKAEYNAKLSALMGGSGVGYASYSVIYPDLSRRFGTNSEFANDLYMYTENPDSNGREGFSFVRINLDEGEELGRAWVNQRKPEYEFDPIDQIVYVRRDRTIEAWTFELVH